MAADPPITHVFAGEYLDRAARLRTDPEYLEAARGDPATLFVPVWRGKNLLTKGDQPEAVWLSNAALKARDFDGNDPTGRQGNCRSLS